MDLRLWWPPWPFRPRRPEVGRALLAAAAGREWWLTPLAQGVPVALPRRVDPEVEDNALTFRAQWVISHDALVDEIRVTLGDDVIQKTLPTSRQARRGDDLTVTYRMDAS